MTAYVPYNSSNASHSKRVPNRPRPAELEHLQDEQLLGGTIYDEKRLKAKAGRHEAKKVRGYALLLCQAFHQCRVCEAVHGYRPAVLSNPKIMGSFFPSTNGYPMGFWLVPLQTQPLRYLTQATPSAVPLPCHLFQELLGHRSPILGVPCFHRYVPDILFNLCFAQHPKCHWGFTWDLYTAVIIMFVESSALSRAVVCLLYIVSDSTAAGSFVSLIFASPLGEIQVRAFLPFLQRTAIPALASSNR